MRTTSSSSVADPSARTREPAVICRPAEAAFQKGLDALKSGEPTTARVFFEAAIDLQRKSGQAEVQPRYLSYLGLVLMDQQGQRSAPLELCRRAVREEFFNPDLFLNLSLVCLRYGLKAEAYRAALRGLALDPRHAGIKRHLAGMGIRRRPLLRFLSRSNALNVALGKIFASSSQT